MTFGERLGRGLDERGPLCVGIDPHPALLAAWGLTDDADGAGALRRHLRRRRSPTPRR